MENNYTAILVDGAFYRKRAFWAYGDKPPAERANELVTYCVRHLKERSMEHKLYRIFYYDCPPIETMVYHPFLRKTISLATSDVYKWTNEFFDSLKTKRKVALRMGEINKNSVKYIIKADTMKKLCNGAIKWEDLSEHDFRLEMDQKGVDMRIGLDIASLAYKKQVQQIVLISGDSDFVSAAKLARREGIDFVLDPLGANIKPDLMEHIDGLMSCDSKYTSKK